jgi:acyl dehydratase|tara:strand:- start:3575 stop:4438 length:864 start_codon:yes stop_codon:yes gene_type:complete
VLDVDTVKNWHFPEQKQCYTESDSMLYALALGYGQQPTCAEELRFVYEKALMAVPTMATTLCHPGFWVSDPKTGIDATRVVHGEHLMRFHKPLQPAGTVRGKTRVTDVIDKGGDKGAIVLTERSLFDDETDELLVSIEQLTLCRGDGGFSGKAPAKKTSSGKAFLPNGNADHRVKIPTLPQAALLYRLNGDLNPLHADPVVAEKAGFKGPILHGLCTYGIAARAILASCLRNDPARLASLKVRFSSPVYPGETIITEIWREQSHINFQCIVAERKVVVVSNGIAETT